MSTRATVLACSLAASFAILGCHRPQGAMMAYTGGSHTYFSTEKQPKTVRVIDLRTEEVLFSMDIPAGKQLTMDFVPGEGDDPVYTPDLMRYQVWDIGTETGTLQNSLTVPAAGSRRIDVFMRQGTEFAEASPERVLRADEVGDRPDWWTSEGGEMPEDPKGVSNYD
jgi:hypothetical protein